MDIERYRLRSSIIQEIRSFFTARSYLEVDTPILAPACIPESSIPLFKTVQLHPFEDPRALQLLPSPEYYIKQLLAAGWGSMFQLAKSFRNGENVGRIHAAEFTMLEYYGTGLDYRDSMDLTEELLIHLAQSCDSPVAPEPGPFARISMAEAFERYAEIDLEELCGDDGAIPVREDIHRARKILRSLGLSWDERDNWEMLFNRVFLNLVEPRLESHGRPLFLTEYPKKLQSLSAPIADSPWSQRWELYWQGIELANCFTEETDSQRLREFFTHEIRAMTREQDEAMQTLADPLFPEKIAGMPDCSGTAMGLDRLIMILSGAERLSEVMLFPLG
jgi:lysyl-tRNA synthetase class 2